MKKLIFSIIGSVIIISASAQVKKDLPDSLFYKMGKLRDYESARIFQALGMWQAKLFEQTDISAKEAAMQSLWADSLKQTIGMYYNKLHPPVIQKPKPDSVNKKSPN